METTRLKQLRKLITENFNGSQKDLSLRTGVSLSQLGQYLGGYRNLGEKTARKIEMACGKPSGWLDQTSPSTNIQNVSEIDIGTRKIPLISYVQAGCMSEIVDPYQLGDASEYLLTDLELSSSAFALQIKGDSMLPDFKEGDRIIIDPHVHPLPGDFVVAKNGHEEATFKKYRPRGISPQGQEIFELLPLNDDYPSMRSDSTPLKIIGTMIEHRRYRKK